MGAPESRPMAHCGRPHLAGLGRAVESAPWPAVAPSIHTSSSASPATRRRCRWRVRTGAWRSATIRTFTRGPWTRRSGCGPSTRRGPSCRIRSSRADYDRSHPSSGTPPAATGAPLARRSSPRRRRRRAPGRPGERRRPRRAPRRGRCASPGKSRSLGRGARHDRRRRSQPSATPAGRRSWRAALILGLLLGAIVVGRLNL